MHWFFGQPLRSSHDPGISRSANPARTCSRTRVGKWIAWHYHTPQRFCCVIMLSSSFSTMSLEGNCSSKHIGPYEGRNLSETNCISM
jgi:hypothetical protein